MMQHLPSRLSQGGGRRPPSGPCHELWLAVGRRGGKSHVAGLLAIFEALFHDHRYKLALGEIATCMIIAADRKQARSVMRYISGLINATPMLKRMVIRENTEAIEFTNRASIEVHTASMRAVRGYTLSAVICDEVAFWLQDGVSPDEEIVAALRPALATLGGKLIALSSPYARRGVLWQAYKKHYVQNGPILVAQAPTITMNPTLPARVVADVNMPD
jgi:phage terminase large subunit-like protein